MTEEEENEERERNDLAEQYRRLAEQNNRELASLEARLRTQTDAARMALAGEGREEATCDWCGSALVR